MNNKIVMDVEDARDYAYSLKGHSFDGFTVVRNDQTDSSRWSAIYELVLERDGVNEFYATSYQRSLTEMQYQQPFEDEGEEITFNQVWPHQVTATEFRDFPPGGKK